MAVMLRKSGILPLILLAANVAISYGGHPAGPASLGRLYDIIWVWGIPEGTGGYEMGKGQLIVTADPAQFAQASARSKADILGVQNIVMAGAGLPREAGKAEEFSRQISDLNRIVWELTPDNGEGPPFEYVEKVRVLKRVKSLYPRVEAVLIDDMLTSQRQKGLRPEHIGTLRQQLRSDIPGIKMWGVVYTMNLDDPLLPQCLRFLDVVNLWTWQAEEVLNLDKNFAIIEKLASGKPIVLGLYMYDYGKNRKMPRHLMQFQCDKALALAKEGRIQGLVFLAVNNDAETINWTRNWIKKVADESIPRLPTRSQ